MELNDEERYALASLFTLALHSSQYDGGNVTEEAWGEPPAVERDPHLISDLTQAELEVWWGYDLVAPGGLLDRIFRELELPATKWKGLKLLPTAAPSAGEEAFRQMVRGLIAMLDSDLAAALPPLLPRRDSRMGSRPSSGSGGGGGGGGRTGLESPISPPGGGRRAVRDDLFTGLINSDSEDEESDEDWAADLAREQKVQASAERKRLGAGRRQLSDETETLLRLTRRLSDGCTLASEAGSPQQKPASGEGHQQQPGQPQPGQPGQQQQGGVGLWQAAEQQTAAAAATATAADCSRLPPPLQRVASSAVDTTPKAMGAMWELVQCCVGTCPLPADRHAPKLPRAVDVRWYDARARVALLLVASWLQVPARKVSNLELLLTQDKAPRHKALSGVEEDSWARRMRYFKVGAAAVGGGALFAVTGGLAAPAIAAGMGSILGFIGAPTAIAGTLTGFLASTAGAATVTTTMAASGTATFGSRMAYRVAEISEFGFKELLPQEQQKQVGAPPLPAPPSPAPPQAQAQAQKGGLPAQQAQQAMSPFAATAAATAARAGSPQPVWPAGIGELQGEASGDAGMVRGQGSSAGGDAGHVHLLASAGASGGSGSSSYHSARAQALNRPARASSFGSAASSGSSSLPRGGGGSSGALQQQAAQPPPPGEQQQSTWQRWFGGGGNSGTGGGDSSAGGSGSGSKKEDLLLPVPMRSRQSGDVKLCVSIYVAGWIDKKEDFEGTWRGCITPGDSDCFTLVWESNVLFHLSSQMGRLLTTQAAGQGLQLATHSFFYAGAGLVAALGPTVLLGAASGLLISNAWAVASDRAVKAGKLLALLLLSGAHGDRPVKLVAHGMGARLVFHCLLELCRQGARGVVQHCVLMGCPVGTEGVRWRMARRAVAGRLVNAYSRKDWLLGVCAGGSSGWMKATAGLVPIEDVPGVENVNLSNLVDGGLGHFAYIDELPAIMDMLLL